MSSTRRLIVAASMVALVSLAAFAFAASTPRDAVPYPEGYRQWTHLKSMAIVSAEHPLFESFGGIHHVYVNRIGLEAARRGGTFADGSVLVFDLLAAESKDGAVTEGARKFIGVMRKDAKRHAATGGWGFEAFGGDSRDQRVVKDAAGQCFGCHQSQSGRDFVFSAYRP
jgi:hypothetical protein